MRRRGTIAMRVLAVTLALAVLVDGARAQAQSIETHAPHDAPLLVVTQQGIGAYSIEVLRADGRARVGGICETPCMPYVPPGRVRVRAYGTHLRTARIALDVPAAGRILRLRPRSRARYAWGLATTIQSGVLGVISVLTIGLGVLAANARCPMIPGENCRQDPGPGIAISTAGAFGEVASIVGMIAGLWMIYEPPVVLGRMPLRLGVAFAPDGLNVGATIAY